MKAMIFAAGLGTRLRPLTNDKPKALVPYKGKPLIQIVIENLKRQGIDEFVVNVHHFAPKVIDFITEMNNFNAKIQISDETDILLETGGGLHKASKYLKNNTFLIYNVDILSNINIKSLIEHHKKSNSIATLAVQKRESSKRLYFNNDGFLVKWKNEKTGEEKISRQCNKSLPFAFSGIHVVEPKIFNYMEHGVYSIIETYLLVAKTQKITFFDHTNTLWRDMGKPESFNL